MAEMRSWIFQGRPDQYDLRSALASLTELSWLVRRYRDEIHVGDRAYLWESGAAGGILAEAHVLTEPAELVETKEEQAYWIRPEEFVGPRLRVRLAVDRLLDPPLSRTAIKGNPGLEALLILRFASGTNFPVDPGLDGALQAMLSARLGTHRSAEALLGALVGVSIPTVTGAPNAVLRVDPPDVLVRTERSPRGQRVPIRLCRMLWTPCSPSAL